MKTTRKTVFALILAALLAPAVSAETVLICHAQSVPVTLTKTFRSSLSNTLLEGVFDYYFAKGDIAFDTAFSLADGVPTPVWLGHLSNRFGADKVVYVQVIWKNGPDDQAVLDRIDYQIVAPSGNVLREGTLSADLTSPSDNEEKANEEVTGKVVKGLAS